MNRVIPPHQAQQPPPPLTSLPPLPKDEDPAPVSPVLPRRLATILGDHKDASFLVKGFSEGFLIPHSELSLSWSKRNHPSAHAQSQFLRGYIQEELQAGRLLGPFNELPHPSFILSPLGVVPKKEHGSFRVIGDFSYPKGCSENDLIPNDLTAISYEDFDHVASQIVTQGVGALISKVDIKSAFCILPIHPSYIYLFGFTFKDSYFMDKCLPLGCSLSCVLFETFSTDIQDFLISKYSFHCVSHILDDFIFIGPSGSQLCQKQLDCFLDLSDYSGVPIKSSKTVYPTRGGPIHGIFVNTNDLMARLPADKLTPLTALLHRFKDKGSACLRDWQSLMAHLSFASCVIHPRQPFVRKFVDCIKGVSNAHHHVKISSEIRKDICVWLALLRDFNGISLLSPHVDQTYVCFSFHSDASRWGCVAIFQHQ